MVRSIDITGSKEAVTVVIDGMQATAFDRLKGINSKDMYDAFDYHAGDEYAVRNATEGDFPKDVFNSFVSLVRDVVTGLNELQVNDMDEADEDVAGSASSE